MEKVRTTKITLDTRFNDAFGPVTLREAVRRMKAHEMACTVEPELLEGKANVFCDCVERGFTRSAARSWRPTTWPNATPRSTRSTEG
ncbi:hypothetical protein [Nonomuraea recticatena]|uniref:hypothetical protein n=1 Tax=Nonomuraea recticatena TaxID=46178 RepID=UPI003610FDD9